MAEPTEQVSGDDLYAIKDIDLYSILCITKETFTPELEKKKYRKLVIKYHPDKNVDDPQCEDKYHMLQLAHHVLSNPEYKTMYDYIYQSSQEVEDYGDLKNANRQNPDINYMTEDEFYGKLRDLNLEADPNYYDIDDKTRDATNEAQKRRDNDISSLVQLQQNDIQNLRDEMKEQFQDDMNMLNDITNDDDRQKKFNEMFDMAAEEDVDCEDLMLYNGNTSMINMNTASTTDYNTMYSNGNGNIDSVFKISKIGFSQEEQDEMNMSLEEQMAAYENQKDSLYELAKKSTLKNGMADLPSDFA